MGIKIKKIPGGFFGFGTDIDIVRTGKGKSKEEKERERQAKLGAKRAKEIRKLKGEEVMFAARASREKQKASLRTAKQAGRKQSSFSFGKTFGRTKKHKKGWSLF